MHCFEKKDHIQEWLKKCPAALGKELWIIQNEISGCSETNKRTIRSSNIPFHSEQRN